MPTLANDAGSGAMLVARQFMLAVYAGLPSDTEVRWTFLPNEGRAFGTEGQPHVVEVSVLDHPVAYLTIVTGKGEPHLSHGEWFDAQSKVWRPTNFEYRMAPAAAARALLEEERIWTRWTAPSSAPCPIMFLFSRYRERKDPLTLAQLGVILRPMLVRRVTRVHRADPVIVEDAVDFALARLGRRATSIRGRTRGSLQGWLFRVAERQAGRLRKIASRYDSDVLDESEVAAPPTGDREAGIDLEPVFSELPPALREDLARHYVLGMTIRELAAQGRPIRSVRRARELLMLAACSRWFASARLDRPCDVPLLLDLHQQYLSFFKDLRRVVRWLDARETQYDSHSVFGWLNVLPADPSCVASLTRPRPPGADPAVALRKGWTATAIVRTAVGEWVDRDLAILATYYFDLHGSEDLPPAHLRTLVARLGWPPSMTTDHVHAIVAAAQARLPIIFDLTIAAYRRGDVR